MFDPNYKRGSEETLHKLIEYCPDNPEAYQKLAGIYFRRGKLKDALRCFTGALKVDPDDPFTCLYFGTFLDFLKQKDKALELFLHAEKNAPSFSVVHWCLGNLYRSMARYDDAQRSYERAVAVSPENETAKTKLVEWKEFVAEHKLDVGHD